MEVIVKGRGSALEHVVDLEVPSGTLIGDVVSRLIDHLGFPVIGRDGSTVGYSLVLDDLVMDPAQSFDSVGVRRGSVMVLAPQMKAAQAVAHIVLDDGVIYPLSIGSVQIGRDPGCPITVDHPEVSRRHAILHVDDAGAMIEDLGSANGTTLDGVRVEGRSEWMPTQVCGLGAVRVRLVWHASSDCELCPSAATVG
jgi:hypothetical protein